MLNALSDLEWIVIDEVHELLGSERGSQLSLSLERLQLNSNYPLTKIGLSATVGNFEEASKFVVGTKRKCKIIRDSSVRDYDVEVKYVDGTISDVADKIIEYVVNLDLDSPILLFTNTRGEAEFLASIMKEKSSINIELHHGSLSKEVREDTEISLREGKRGIVVCTSSLELGLDIGSVELVIHYGSPRQVSKLMQRIGRSRHNRNESAKGLVITNNPDDEFESMGCNVLAIAPRQCIMVDGNPKTKQLLEQAGCEVTAYRGNDISVKGGGGPTCLTRPLSRSY